ncbi:hypothetical protein RIVM261_032390 [Rivularia sp. IAM M-261]|nr:hypothetical protein CAL7716_096340 [Calothrix sp. PCC 7716]GJD18283.1 hypothetical protein RIVM261_032390 [Rivularia sp. IAM M-261]
MSVPKINSGNAMKVAVIDSGAELVNAKYPGKAYKTPTKNSEKMNPIIPTSSLNIWRRCGKSHCSNNHHEQ